VTAVHIGHDAKQTNISRVKIGWTIMVPEETNSGADIPPNESGEEEAAASQHVFARPKAPVSPASPTSYQRQLVCAYQKKMLQYFSSAMCRRVQRI